MSTFLVLLSLLALAAVVGTIRDLRTDGLRARAVDPELRSRLLDPEAMRRAAADARAALAAARTAPVPPRLAEYRSAAAAAPRPALRVQRSLR
ncbi:hypothetical protein GCM10009846_25000 [Agrococcus versicolor]|uniref:Uncharacterized protein n=1 Tax=Agrococcus versicolor TaxID=501482 RepID=A0ABN3AVN2_9MICO